MVKVAESLSTGGRFSQEAKAASASCTNLRFRLASATFSGGRTLRATRRSRWVSRAPCHPRPAPEFDSERWSCLQLARTARVIDGDCGLRKDLEPRQSLGSRARVDP